MARPRRIIPGATYLVTRRTWQRVHRLRPHPRTNEIAEYCLAWAAAKTGVLVHAWTVMSNHHHLVVTDVEGRLPEFTREFHRTFAKALNALQGQWESLWSAEPVSVVRLTAFDDVVNKAAYVATNPVAAGLVKSPSEWPGVNYWGSYSKEVRRPAVYFDAAGQMPELVPLRIVPPTPERKHVWADRVRAAIGVRLRKLKRHRRPFLGAHAVMAESFLARATGREPKRALNPVIAAADVERRAASLRVEKTFRLAYRAALRAWRNGDRFVVFPRGTWWMTVHHGALSVDNTS